MDKQPPDFWAMEDRHLLERWPKTPDGQPQPAAKLAIQWELDSMADITLSLLESCGIPAFKSGSLGKVLGGFASQGVEIWVPADRLEEAQALLDAASPGETVEIPADIQQPHVTAAELKEVLFRDVLGQCRTHVSGTSARINNVKLSAAACNGVVLNSGDVFSYNATTGQRTTAKGYQAAPAYVGGETVDEVGGGVCQTSSTIYYACLRANLEITERYAHRYVPAYIDWGMDATVSWGGPDYKFTNNTDYPIKIVATYSGGYLTVKILGTNVDGTYVKMTNEVLSKTDWETVYKDDETLPAGTEKVTKPLPTRATRCAPTAISTMPTAN